ncbi:MAG TPA: cellulase family glycosylhydrolase, partial [Chitinophagaceae bacterium]|nr:cellulase family glycosylhydrolase [Chitinophagaceae bacterium]
WDQDIHLVAADPIKNASNIMYTLHFYAATHKQWLRDRADSALKMGIPIFISESAGMQATGDGPINYEEWRLWIDWAEQRGLSWITWSVSDKEETCSVLQKSASSTGNWKETDLKESGIKARDLIRYYNDNKNSLKGKDLYPVGRTAITSDGALELISSASYFAFSYEGDSCQLFVSLDSLQDHNYLQYEIDAVYQKRIRISGKDNAPLTLAAAGEGKHTIRIYKTTEAQTGPLFIQRIQGDNLAPIKPSRAPFIEFIGNSITCGAAADVSEVPCGLGEYQDQHNAYYAYGPRIARALGANFMVSSVSGIGVYRNWNSNGPTMPQVYEHTDLKMNSARNWDFSIYNPKIVSIALGTNDFSDGDGKAKRLPFDSADFVNQYIRFVQLIKSKYPLARILLLSSAVIHGQKRVTLQNCLSAVKRAVDKNYPSDLPVTTCFLKEMTARGCSGHP